MTLVCFISWFCDYAGEYNLRLGITKELHPELVSTHQGMLHLCMPIPKPCWEMTILFWLTPLYRLLALNYSQESHKLWCSPSKTFCVRVQWQSILQLAPNLHTKQDLHSHFLWPCKLIDSIMRLSLCWDQKTRPHSSPVASVLSINTSRYRYKYKQIS